MSEDFKQAYNDAKQHARKVFPVESCGLIVDGIYVPCENKSADPSTHKDDPDCNCQLCSFRIDSKVIVKHHGHIDVIVHSHPNGPLFPSLVDAQQQRITGLKWAIIPLDEDRMGDPVVWGGDTDIAPVIGRKFMHFTSDCYTLIRDCYRLGADALLEQGITEWPFQKIDLPDFPRDDAWWEKEADFYNTEPSKIGFREIAKSEAKPGDVFLMSIRSEKMNHGGLLVGQGLILHHLPTRMSRREPAALWARQAKRWLRWTGEAENA